MPTDKDTSCSFTGLFLHRPSRAHHIRATARHENPPARACSCCYSRTAIAVALDLRARAAPGSPRAAPRRSHSPRARAAGCPRPPRAAAPSSAGPPAAPPPPHGACSRRPPPAAARRPPRLAPQTPPRAPHAPRPAAAAERASRSVSAQPAPAPPPARPRAALGRGGGGARSDGARSQAPARPPARSRTPPHATCACAGRLLL
mmetsp:Transcript_72585/g.199023  ORF Transcript_72585/g.199023 Transcript_72585/m.199023 type:complete len:203 (+) Transcript_72585:1964-2572(+)